MTLTTFLPEETFGERFTRARGQRKMGLRAVAHEISKFVPTSMSTLSRIEGLAVPPTSQRSRAIATIYALALGYHPSVFGLSMDDLPSGLDPEVVADLLNPGTAWSPVLAGEAA